MVRQIQRPDAAVIVNGSIEEKPHTDENELICAATPTINPYSAQFLISRKILPYSCRSAFIGSTRVARRAGIEQASSATVVKRSTTDVNVKGSVLLTP